MSDNARYIHGLDQFTAKIRDEVDEYLRDVKALAAKDGRERALLNYSHVLARTHGKLRLATIATEAFLQLGELRR